MFCHHCGKTLVEGSRFCSWCGTAVPQQVWEDTEERPAAPEESAPETRVSGTTEPDIPAPEESAPKTRGPEATERAIPAPEESAPETRVPETTEPEVPAPDIPAPEAIDPDMAVPEESAPEQADTAAPPAFEGPAQVPEREAVLPPEKIVMSLSVTEGQIAREETVLLRHEALCEPMELVLRGGMKDGMKLRLTNAPLKPSPVGAERRLIVRLCVSPSEEAPERDGAPAAPPVERLSPAAPVERPAPPEPAERPAQHAPAATRPSFEPASSKCIFQLTEGSEHKGYRFGGADEEGVVLIEPSGITLYKKSKAVAMAFGLIGRLLEGKGKLFAVVRPEDIGSYEKEVKRSGQCVYRMRLKDGRLFKLGIANVWAKSALDTLLSGI